MGGAIEYVFWQGCRLTPWMLFVLLQLDAQLWARWGLRLILVSAIRTFEQQKAIFLKRYVRYADINGRRVYDTRVWNGVRYYRIDPTGTVRQPGLSNHEIRGDVAAVDIKDTGSDPGITAKNSLRGRWLREVFGPQFGMDPEGDSFAEGWHHRMRGIFRTPPSRPAGGSTTTTTSKEIKVKHYFNDDGKARRKGGVDLKPNASTWLKKDAKAASSQADNIVGGVGEYQFTVHVYAEGKPGDVVDLVLAWDNTKTKGAHSMHFVERIEIGADGFARRNVPFARAVATGYAVYARLATPAGNKAPVKVTRFAADALLFIGG